MRSVAPEFTFRTSQSKPRLCRQWGGGRCCGPHCRALGTSSLCNARLPCWACAKHTRGQGRHECEGVPRTQLVPLLEMWLPRTWTSIQSFQVNLWPHWPVWAAGHCWGPGCFFECLSRALPCLTTPLCCMWTRPPHLSHHGASDCCRQTQATSKAACLQVLVGSHTLSLGDN